MKISTTLPCFALFCAVSFGVMILPGCQSHEEETFPPKLPSPTPIAMHPLSKSVVVSGNTTFGINLLQKLALDLKPNENLFLSPYSVSQALLLAANGAQGEMRTGLLSLLALDNTPIDVVNSDSQTLMGLLVPPVQSENGSSALAYDWIVANAIWSKFTIKQEYVDRCARYYRADAMPFIGVSGVNLWASEKTRGMIPQIIDDSLPEKVDLLLTNAVYFKARWETPFAEYATSDETFYRVGDTSTKPFMHREDWQMRWHAGNNYEAVSLPYRGGVSMTVILPRRGISAVEFAESLSPGEWQILQDSFQSKWVALSLPKFEIECDRELKKTLESLGMPKQGDFSLISEAFHGTEITDVVHKTFLRVNETGTEAAAVTAVGAPAGAAMPESITKPHPFVVNRPFLCAIVHDTTGTVLFLGVINDPKVLQ